MLRGHKFYEVGIDQEITRQWQDPATDQLDVRAAQTPGRASRTLMYREADRDLVKEKAHLAPVGYGEGEICLDISCASNILLLNTLSTPPG